LKERVQAACITQLASFKQPVEIHLIEDFPRSTLEKIAKAQLREMLEQSGG
jgi:crotonobetaine/carnitine-CoA ligase